MITFTDTVAHTTQVDSISRGNYPSWYDLSWFQVTTSQGLFNALGFKGVKELDENSVRGAQPAPEAEYYRSVPRAFIDCHEPSRFMVDTLYNAGYIEVDLVCPRCGDVVGCASYSLGADGYYIRTDSEYYWGDCPCKEWEEWHNHCGEGTPLHVAEEAYVASGFTCPLTVPCPPDRDRWQWYSELKAIFPTLTGVGYRRAKAGYMPRFS